MEEQYMSEGPTSDWQTVINSVHYKSMKKLMALVDTRTYDTIEEFTTLAEYFPAMRNNYPEYHGITQAYVPAFNDTTVDMRKGDNAAPVENKQYKIKSMMSRLKKASSLEGKVVKQHAAAVVPIVVPGEEKKLSESELETTTEAFCVESYKAARIRRIRNMFPKMEVKSISSAKVAPCLFRSQTRKTQVRTAADLHRIAAIFCVETHEQAKERRINNARVGNYKSQRSDVVHPIYPHIGKLDLGQKPDDHLDNVQSMYTNISQWVVLDNNVYMADLDDDALDGDGEVGATTDSNTDKNNDKNGKVSRYLKSFRKMFKRSEK